MNRSGLARWWVLVSLAACGDPASGPVLPDASSFADSDAAESDLLGDAPATPDLGSDSQADSNDPIDPIDLAEDPDAHPDVALPDMPDVADLQIRAVSPERGPMRGGTELLILGLNFTPSVSVLLGGVPCENVDVIDETKIACVTPPGAPGPVSLKLVAGAVEATLPDAFEYLPDLVVDTVDPAYGPVRGGMPARVYGRGFGPDTQVSLGGRAALDVQWLDEGTLEVLTPPGEPGWQSIQVSAVDGIFRLEAGFEYFEPPRIDRIRPGAGAPDGGELVELLGVGLDVELEAVHFGLVQAEVVESEPGRLVVVAPPGPADAAVDVTVTTSRAGAWTAIDGFFYWGDPSGPALLHISPRRGSISGGTTVVISGIGLAETSRVRFGATTAEIADQTDSWVEVVSPPTETPRTVNIALELPSGWLLEDNAFEYLPGIAITSLDPDRGDVSGGNIVRVYGTGFAPGLTVHVGPLPLANVQVLDSEELTGIAPPGAPGPADVRIESALGVAAVDEGGYLYTAEAVVHGFEPPRGSWAGGTRVVVRGRALLEPVEVVFGGEPAAVVEWLDPSTVAAYTPRASAEAFVDVSVRSAGGPWLTAPERFLYFDPQSPSPGVWGEPIAGAVNVTVVTDRGSLLSDAFVMLGVRDEPPYAGYTDANGQVTLSGDPLEGPQTVTASRPGYSATVLYDVPGENVTLALRCAHDGLCVGDGDCRLGMVCQDGLCLDPPCAGTGFGGTPSSFATITGQLDGLDKIGDPGPDEMLLAGIYTTTEGPWSVGTIFPTSGNVLLENGPYTITSRLGALAVVAVCGMYNQSTRAFRPIRMGIARGLFLSAEQVATVDLTCDIWMDETLTVKATDSPLGPAGPTIFRHLPVLELGSDGYFGGLVTLEGASDVLSLEGFAPIEGPLADASYIIRGGAFNTYSWPYSISVLSGVRSLDEVVTLPPFVTVAHLTTPSPEAAEPVVEGYLEWTTPTDRVPDLWRIQFRDFSGTTWWDAVVPGETTRINLPDWPNAGEVGLFPSGPMFTIFRGLDIEPFDLGDYDDADFATGFLGRYSISAFTIVNP